MTFDQEKYEKWYEKNRDKLTEKYASENPEIMRCKDDYMEQEDNGNIFEWAEEIYLKETGGGYEVRTTRNPKWTAYSTKYFLTQDEARRYGKEMKRKFGELYRVIPNSDIVKHRCGRLIDANDGCLMCEKIEYDAYLDRQAEQEEAENMQDPNEGLWEPSR